MAECQTTQACDRTRPEHCSEACITVSLPGRYIMPQRRGTRRRPPEYACRMVNISPRAMVLAGPVIGALDEPVVAYFEELGKFEGQVTGTLCGGFVIAIAVTDAEWAHHETKLIWLERNQRENMPDSRAQKRIVPRDPRSTLILVDGTTLPCFVIDMSASGVAVSAEIKPRIGTPLAVGKAVGKVVRRFAEGFAVRFVAAQDPRFIEQLVTRPFDAPPPGQAGLDRGGLLPDSVERWLRAR